MRVAVTGASGFVGRHVVQALVQRGIAPVVTLRADAAAAPWLSQLEQVRLDIARPPDDAYAALGRPNVLMHLAWDGLPNYRSSHHTEQVLPSQEAFLHAMVGAGLETLLVTGTCFEYGMQSGVLEETLPANPDNSYAVAKNSLRRSLERLHSVRPFYFTWARLFYLFGEGQNSNSLLPQLRRAVAQGAASFDMSGGEQLRDYLPVTEAAGYLVALALAQRPHGIVNVCSGQPVQIRNLVEGWIAQHDWPIKPNFGRYPYSDYEPMAFWGDTAKLRRCLEVL